MARQKSRSCCGAAAANAESSKLAASNMRHADTAGLIIMLPMVSLVGRRGSGEGA